MTPYLLGIAGPSAAGKTTLGHYLSDRHAQITHLRQDDFLKDPATFPRLGKWHNWEHPQNIQFDAMVKALHDLKAGKTITTPRGWEVKPSPIILVEGSLIFTDERLNALFDRRVALTLPQELQLKRRLQRQPEVPEHEEYFWEVVVPYFKAHGEPSLKHAAVYLSGDLPVEKIAEQILALIPKDYLQAEIAT